ncbi:MAG: Inner membrane protein YdcO [Pelotomaculum sp. PtaU1.Bin065]|nr:MAG: Inner membrane protein YdcO [Pelotomaculum sp. PtaU1.Bin065]
MSKGLLERGPGIRESLKALPHSFNINNVTAALIATVFSLSGPIILLINIANEAHLTDQQTVTWLMSIYFISGALMVFLSLYYQQPIAIAFSLPGIIVIGSLMKVFSLNQMVGGYIFGGLILLFLGVTGLIKTVVKYLPLPIIMGMIAGALFSYAMGIVTSVQKDYIGAGITLLAFFVSRLFTKKIPPQAIALVVGVIVSIYLMKSKMAMGDLFYAPLLIKPDFGFAAILSIGVPLVLLGLADFLKGYGILTANKFDAPVNAMITSTGICSTIGAFFLAHSITVAGPVTAITSCDDAGPKDYRWVAGFLKGIIQVFVAFISGLLVPFLRSLPATVANVLAGLAMVSLFITAFEVAFSSKNKFQMGAFFAFIVAYSNFSIYNISSPVWSLLVGIIVSLIFERENVKSFLHPIVEADGIASSRG